MLPNDYPSAAEFGQLRAFLALQGFSQEWINQTIGENPSSFTRSELSDLLKEALKELPAAS